MNTSVRETWVLQLCHGYDMPFHDIARQYTTYLKALNFKVVTVFLTGKKNAEIAEYTGSDEIVFLENTSKDLRGTKKPSNQTSQGNIR